MSEVIKRELARISVWGVVQGVGFRPFIYQLAVKHGLNGRVSNTSEDVRIEVEGEPGSINPVDTDDVITTSADLLRQGKIIAVKGLGGFLLACDACSEKTANLLRDRKHRPFKPFAVMMLTIEEVKNHCEITPEEEKLIISPNSPIVLVKWRQV